MILDRAAVRALAVASLLAAIWLAGWLPVFERPLDDLVLRTTPLPGLEDIPVAAVVIDDASVHELGGLPPDRAALAAMVDRTWDAGAIGIALDILLLEDRTGDERLAAALARGPTALAATFAVDGGGWLLPTAAFGGGGRAVHAYAETARDGVVRTIAATKQRAGVALPALSLAAAQMADPSIGAPAGSLIRPAFRPPPQALPAVSAAALITGRDDGARLRNRVVFIGVSATGAGDVFVVPTGRRGRPEPGVLVHASAAASLLTRRTLTAPSLPILAAGGFLVALAVDRLRPRRISLRPAVLAAAGLAIFGAAVAALSLTGIQLPVAGLLLAVPLAALLREGVEGRAAEREAGRLLDGLVTTLGLRPPSGVARGAAGRLTAVRALQGELARRNALQRALLDGLEEGVVLWDAEGRPLATNQAAQRLWGRIPRVADLPDPERGRDTTARGGRLLEVSTAALDDRRLGLIRDVTAERELEARRREMQRLVSHELRTPLASIAGLADMVGRYALDPGELDRVAGLIGGESRRLMEMTEAFLDLERLAAGTWSGSREQVDLGLLVAARCELLAGAAAARGQTLTIEAREGCAVRGAAELLGRIVDNLVGNALKYSGDGTVVEVRTSTTDGTAAVEVRDHGPGIPAEALPRLFDRFFRVPGTSVAGTGLGLALVREVVEWHGGRVEVTSELGVGTVFRVELPAADERETAS